MAEIKPPIATNTLINMVESDRFPHDLYYRLSGFPVNIPPRRDLEHGSRADFSDLPAEEQQHALLDPHSDDDVMAVPKAHNCRRAIATQRLGVSERAVYRYLQRLCRNPA